MPATPRSGPSFRVGIRTRRYTKQELARLNSEYDAILVSNLSVARNLAAGFMGTVLFRDFGNLPGAPSSYRERFVGRGSSIIHVPIFSTLPRPRRVAQSLVLRTVAPAWPEFPTIPSVPRRYIGVFAAVIVQEPWFIPWLRDLASVVPDHTIRVYGTSARWRAEIESVGALQMPRLAGSHYRESFASNELWIYPHGDPRHSHYIPLEAIQLGIPCLLTCATAVARESGIHADTTPEKFGVSRSVHGLIEMTKELLGAKQEALGVLVQRQSLLLEPFSESRVREQARDLAAEVKVHLAMHKRPSTRHLFRNQGSEVNLPSGEQYRFAIKHGQKSLGVSASAVVAPARIRAPLDVDFVSSPDDPLGPRNCINLIPRFDSQLLLGPLSLDCAITRVSVRISVTGARRELPLAIEVKRQDEVVYIEPLIASNVQSDSHWVDYVGSVEIKPLDGVHVRIVNSLVPAGSLIGHVAAELEPSRTPQPSSPQAIRNIPFWSVVITHRMQRLIHKFRPAQFAALQLDPDRLKVVLMLGEESMLALETDKPKGWVAILRRSRSNSRRSSWKLLQLQLGRLSHSCAFDSSDRDATIVAFGRSTDIASLSLRPVSKGKIWRSHTSHG